ncbi:MAG TPA: type II toxin-antitoxin system VapC family toxin [Candidatus Limnocylindrales bacterium]
MIFVDSNIPMYLIGAEHPNKGSARHLLEVAIAARDQLVTDAEVLQEILHRYVAINRRDAIDAATEALVAVVDQVFPIEQSDVERARRIVLTSQLSARDAIHLAIMQRHEIDQIMTFDRGFDGLPGVTRLAAS